MLPKHTVYTTEDSMLNKDLRILIGPAWIGNWGTFLARAFRERGIKVTNVVNRIPPNWAGLVEYDILIYSRIPNRLLEISMAGYLHLDSSLQHNSSIFQLGSRLLPILKLLGVKTFELFKIFKESYYFFKLFLQHDAFIFLFGISLLPHNLDLPILKLFRKKTVMWFGGGDIFHYESIEAEAKKKGIKYHPGEARRESPDKVEQKKRMIRRVEKYVDHIISPPSISQLLTIKYNIIYAPIDVDNIRYNNVPNPRPIVVHAPRLNRKGTPYILEAVEQLRKEGYDFELYLFNRDTHNTKVREILSEADIVVDHLFSSQNGVFATEAMAAGCAVLGGNIPELSGKPQELPIIHTDPDNIYQNLKMLLENPELRRELGQKGRKYAEKYHDPRKIADDFIRLITTGEASITYPAKNRMFRG